MDWQAAIEKAGAATRGTRREIIALDEGDVVISFPEDLSPESFDDLKSYLDLFIRKMQRRATRGDAWLK